MRHLIALVAGLVAGAAPAQTCGTHCGTERWAVKTLTDADQSHVTLTPMVTTVNQLRALATPVQRPADARVAPTELTTFTTHAVLIGWKPAAHRDFHLAITDPSTPPH